MIDVPDAGERSACDLCGGTSFREWLKIDCKPFYNSNSRLRDLYTIVRCEDCGLVFVKEIPSESELKDVYGEGYYSGRDTVGYKSYRPTSAVERVVQRLGAVPMRLLRLLSKPLTIPARILDAISRPRIRPWPYNLLDMVERHRRPGRLLDVGCATGLFLNAAKQSGWSTQGVELSDYSSGIARREYALDVFTGTLTDAVQKRWLEPESFDVVTLWDTAEHVTFPMRMFRDVWTVLKPGGLVFVKTLNIDSDRSKQEGTGWHFFRPPKHLTYYSEATLKAYLRHAGFALFADDNFANDVVTVVGVKSNSSQHSL